jgi:hypothetical protein
MGKLEKTVSVSNGRASAKVDAEDYEKVSQHTWSLHSEGYAVKNRGGQKTIYMHRLVLPDTEMIDHINLDKLDNRKCNLRATDYSANAMNMGFRKGKNYKGVQWDKSRNKWMVSIQHKFYGRYKTLEEAIKRASEVYG